MPNPVFKLIDQAEIISFDIFDTLLIRPYVRPNDVFLHMSKLYDISDFNNIREQAEVSAWKKYTTSENECTNIEEIYSEMPKKYKGMLQKELDFEFSILMPNPLIQEIYDYAIQKNKKIVIVSDMYLHSDFLKRVLCKNGFKHFNKVYVSGEYRKLKSLGNLFKEVIKECNVNPSKILHIGDNKKIDILPAKKLGIQTYQIERILDKYLDAFPRVKLFLEAHQNNIGASIMVAMIALKYAHSNQNYWEKFGYEYNGPACFAFMKWVEKESTQLNDLIFLGRDGYTLQKIFKKLRPNTQTHYIYTPRSLNLLCLLNYEKEGQFAYEHTKTLIEYYRNKSPLLKDAPHIVSAEEGVAYLEEKKDIFESLAQKELQNYKKYLDAHKITAPKTAIVDTVSLFYSGQRFLQKLLPEKEITGFYYLIQKDALDALDVKTFKKKSYYAPDLRLIEFMISSPEAPILNIENNAPVYKSPVSAEEKKRQEVSSIISGTACDFADDIIRIFHNQEIYLDSETLTDWLMSFIENPNKEDKINFKETPCAYDPQHSEYRPIFSDWYLRKQKNKKFTYLFKVSILGFSIMECRSYPPHKKEFYVLKIPVLSIKTKKDTRVLLFNCIPLLKIKQKRKM